MPSGQSSAVVRAKTCSHLPSEVSGASAGRMRVQAGGRSRSAGACRGSIANSRRTRSCETPFTSTSASAAASWPSRPATALMPCTK